MKMNLKKVGAIVAGAAILASSVAFAGLYYQGTELVDSNGQPLVKVVVGANAQASDGVAAANIAAKIANSAYAAKTLTAAVPNDVTGSCNGNGSGNGSCAISNERVTLEVTVPGATNSGVHDFKTLIGDYIDRHLEDRNNEKDDDMFDISVSELNENADPYSDGNGGVLAGINLDNTDNKIYKIDGNKFAPYKTSTITDSTTGDQYTEYQNAYIAGYTHFVESDNKIEANLDAITYQVKFDDSDNNGIPRCTSDEDNDDNWADCATTDNEYIGAHRVQIDFLGSKWVIIDMTPSTTADIDGTGAKVVTGGSVTLAKESVHGVVPIGEELESSDGNIKVRLDDIALQTGANNEHPAIVSILDKNGNVIKQDQINPGTTQKETVNGVTYKIRVYKTAPGYTMGAKWAEMALIEDELELKDGDKVSDDNELWKVAILWKNKDASATDADTKQPDHLRAILLQRADFDSELVSGDSVNVIENPVAYKLTYKGLDLESDDYDAYLKFDHKTNSKSVKLATGGDTFKFEDYILIHSPNDKAFEYAGGEYGDVIIPLVDLKYDIIADGDLDGDGFTESAFDLNEDGAINGNDDGYIVDDDGVTYKIIDGFIDLNHDDTVDSNDDGNVDIEGTTYTITDGYVDAAAANAPTAADVQQAVIYIKETSSSNADYKYTVFDPAANQDIKYEAAGALTSYASGGVIRVNYPAAGDSWSFEVAEDAGNYNDETTSDSHTRTSMKFKYVIGDKFESDNGNEDKITYSQEHTIKGYSAGDYEEDKFISPRGSEFEEMDSSTVKFKIAKKVGHALFEYATAEAAETGASTEVLTLKEGEEGKVGDVTIKVKSIDEDVGSCTAAGAGTCTIPASSIDAVIMPDNKASVDAIVPYDIQGNLVVLDKDASAAGTNLLITVGGPAVNTVSADALSGDNAVDFNANPVVVKKVGNKIVVAGKTAQDTLTAANNFIASLTKQ